VNNLGKFFTLTQAHLCHYAV